MASKLIYRTRVVVIGAGQAGLSVAYYLRKAGWTVGKEFVVLDQSPRAGGAWQFRWPSLTLSTVNRVHDLPGLPFDSTLQNHGETAQANVAVPHYFETYERTFGIEVYRPVQVSLVCQRDGKFRIETDRGLFACEGLVNATGTWETPYIPSYPGADSFQGRQLHTRDYQSAEDFRGLHVVVVGAGISALQLLDEVSKVATTTWVTRSPPVFRDEPFDETAGREAVALVEDRVRNGLLPGSVVSVTGLRVTPAIQQMEKRGVLVRFPMFQEILPTGIRWEGGLEKNVDVILWCTGFRSSIDHLAPLLLKEEGGGIRMSGRLATQVAKDPRIHLVGYGPSASTIGANRAGRAAVAELLSTLGR
jgi:cation diffusion facilitator CzcD-associated flavoprotein CzcO